MSTLPGWSLSERPTGIIDGNAEPYLTDVGEVAFRSDGGLVVEDNRSAQLHLFDAVGTPLRSIGGRGDGPGEFRNVTELTVGAADTLYVYDRRHSRASQYDPDGDLVTVIDLPREAAGQGSVSFDAWPHGDGLLLHVLGALDLDGSQPVPRLDQRRSVIHRVDRSGRIGSQVEEFMGGYTIVGQRFDGASPFASESLVAVRPGSVVWSPGVDYQVLISSEARGVTHVTWTDWREPNDAASVDEVRDAFSAGLEEVRRVRPERVTALLEAIFAPELVPAEMAALGGLFLDDRGRVWLSRFRPSTHRWDQQHAWHVLDSEGRPLARLLLPRDARLAAVRGDRVAVVVRDELDVQHVHVYGVSEGGER